MDRQRSLPVWLMGFCNLPLGLGGAIGLVTVPQLLAADAVPESTIAWITSAALIPLFASFILAPVLDWRFSRRFYAILTTSLAALLLFAGLLNLDDPLALGLLLVLAVFAVALNQAAVGGWVSSLTGADDKSVLGAWLTVANVMGFGIGAAVAIVLIRALPPVIGPAAVAGLLLLPVPLYLVMPSPPPDARLAHEGFVAFLKDVLALFRQRDVRWLLFFFAMPAASFALSNTMSGLGKDFGASEQFVGTVAGVGVAIAGVLGSLVVPPLIHRLTPDRLYLAIGAGGAVFTVAQLALPLTSLTFAIAMIGQNGIQAAAVSAANVVILRANGEDNPLAATQFALLSAALGLPLSYMQAIDGQAYDQGGLIACYLADALISLAACAILALLLARRRA